MLKNKIIVKKIRNILILLMAIIIMLGAYHNIRNSKAENVIQIEMEVSDKSDVLSAQTVTVDATETSDGNYLLNLPISVNENIVTKYYTSDGEEILVDAENNTATIQLTEAEVTNKKVQLQTDYDTKEVTANNETKVLYNKELKNTPNENGTENQDVTVTGYMPLDAELEVKEIDLATLTGVKLPNEKQTMQKAYEVSIFEMVEKQAVETETTNADMEQTTEGEVQNAETITEATTTEDTTQTEPTVEKDETATEVATPTEDIETERVEYAPSVYEEKITIKTKYAQTDEIITIYNLAEDNQITEIESATDEEYVKFESDKADKTLKYIIATEEVEDEELPLMSATNDDSEITFSTTATSTSTGNTLKSTSSETTETRGFLGNTNIQRQNIESVTFSSDTSGAATVGSGRGLIRSYDGHKNTSSGHSSSTTTWKDLSGNNDGTVNGGTWGSDYLSLDGVDDWVNLGKIDMTITDKVTLDIIIEIDELGSYAILGNQEDGGAALEINERNTSIYSIY